MTDDHDSPAEVPLAIEIVRGTPTDAELAALIAVVSEAYATEASQAAATPVARSRWHVAARGLRAPLRRDLGWGGFTG